MELWHILVLSVVRTGLDANYDRLEDFANHHSLIRKIMGVETGFAEGKVFSIPSIKDNVSLLDGETINRINDVVLGKAEQEEESSKTFKKLRHKHSAVESDINRLEHHGLDRCPDKGLNAFKRYCALGVLAANLHKVGNVLQEKAREQGEKLRKAA